MKSNKLTMLFAVATALALSLACTVTLAVRRSNAHACECCAESVALSLMAFIDSHKGCLPPQYLEDPETGQRHSWRVLVLPHQTYDYIYGGYSFGEPWSSPHNQTLLKNITNYACPAHSRSSEMTNYVAVVGEETVWPKPKTPRDFIYATVGEHNVHWPAPTGKKVLPDCRTKIVLVELVESDIPWMEPRDVTLDEFLAAVTQEPEGAFYNKYVKGIRAIDGAGHVRIIKPYDDIREIRKMFVVGEGEISESEG